MLNCKTYTKHYQNLFNHILVLDKFHDIVEDENLQRLQELNTIFIPNRSFSVYVGYENIESRFLVPMLGNRRILKAEERNLPKNQYYLLKRAGIKSPKNFASPGEIDRLVIVKVPEKQRKIERAFFYASSAKEYARRAEERIRKGVISRDDLREAVIEEYVVGAKFNANFFWSPLDNAIDLLRLKRRPASRLRLSLQQFVRERLLLEQRLIPDFPDVDGQAVIKKVAGK